MGGQCPQPQFPWAWGKRCQKHQHVSGRCTARGEPVSFISLTCCCCFLASKGRLEEVEERAERERGKWAERKKGGGRRNSNRNPSQWIKKQDSSFYRVYFPPAIALPVCLPAPQRPHHDWYALRAKLATETQKIMHKRWTQFIVFSRGPRGKPKLWIYASDPWDRCWAGRRGGEDARARVGQTRTTYWQVAWLAAAGGKPPVLRNFHSFSLCDGSWHHNYIIIGRSHLFIQLRATKMEWAGSLWAPRTGASPLWVALINWFADTRVNAYSKLDIGRRDGCDAVSLMTVFNWSISMGSH